MPDKKTDVTTCPTCGAAAKPIAYGYPGRDLWESSKRGEVVLGGCVISDDDPTHVCERGHRWREER